jgi:hypothetical protein
LEVIMSANPSALLPNSTRHGISPRRSALLAASVAFTAVLAPGAGILIARGHGQPGPSTSQSMAVPADRQTRPAAAQVDTTRLAVFGPRRLLDPASGGALRAGAEARITLPPLAAGTRGVLLDLSIRGATGPGAVTLQSGTERRTVLRVASAGGQSSATAVVNLGADGDLRVKTEGGGRLQVDLLGAFEPARSATAGRLVATAPTQLLQLTPATDGNDVVVDLTRVPALAGAGTVSAILVQAAGDVGAHGGYVSVGPQGGTLDQAVYWSATTGQDRIRPGLMLIPVRSSHLHVQYHAGRQLRLSLVGYVTGTAAPTSRDGLLLVVPAGQAPPVRVTATSRVDVTLVPAGGIAGVAPQQVSAAFVDVTSARRGVLALSPVVDGAVSVTGPGTALTLTTRALVVSDRPRPS